MTKVVLCDSPHFAVSRACWERLLDLGLDPEDEYKGKSNIYFTDVSQLIIYNSTIYLEDKNSYPTFNDYVQFGGISYALNIARTNLLLVQAIEELGELARPMYMYEGIKILGPKLRIVEIPDGVDFYIEFYDKNYEYTEIIRESHRIWK